MPSTSEKVSVKQLFVLFSIVAVYGVMDQLHDRYSIHVLKNELNEFKEKNRTGMEVGSFRESIEATGKIFLHQRRIEVLAGDTKLSLGSYSGNRCVEQPFSSGHGTTANLRFCGDFLDVVHRSGIFLFVVALGFAVLAVFQLLIRKSSAQVRSLKREMKSLAHDLSSPLVGIFFAKDVLKRRDDHRSFQDVIEILETSTRSIEKMKDHNLEESSEGRWSVSKIETLVGERVEYYRRTFPWISFEFESSPSSENLDHGDRKLISVRSEMLERMIDNLLKNSCEELVVVSNRNPDFLARVRVFIDREERGGVSVVVEDSGRGITESQWRAVLLDSIRSTKVRGHGIGLSSSMDYLKTIGGSLDYEKSLLGGARLSIFLRFEGRLGSGLRFLLGRGKGFARQSSSHFNVE